MRRDARRSAESEAAFITQHRAIFRQPEIVVGTWKAARAQLTALSIGSQTNLTALSECPDPNGSPENATSPCADPITEAEVRAALTQLDPLWDELFPAEPSRIVALLVERVDIGTDGLDVRPRVDGLTGLARELAAAVERAA